MKLGIISLGCEKNKVDTELFLGVAVKYGIEITNDLNEADIIVVNTCGFITSAKQESINTILEVAAIKEQRKITVIAIGCLVERYVDTLKQELPEVDIYVPIKDYEHIDELFKKLTSKNESYKFDYCNRVLTTLNHQAFIRIADGCDNKCSYCAIPLIRGGFKSRNYDEIMEEVKLYSSKGAKEIILIAQDTTRFGTDYINDNRRLHNLLHDISLLDDVKIIRVLYLYPDEITDELLEEIANNDKVVKYFDIPIQHANNRLLTLMNRRGSKELIRERINKLRSLSNKVIVRTTVIVGFPSETRKEFNELCDFIKEIKFERLGAFTYSKEEDTKAYGLKKQIKEHIKKKRLNKLMSIQNVISNEFNKSLIGNVYDVIIDSYDYNELAYVARNYMFAPDDVDGKILLYSPVELKPGDVVKCEIIDSSDYDLYAKLSY